MAGTTFEELLPEPCRVAEQRDPTHGIPVKPEVEETWAAPTSREPDFFDHYSALAGVGVIAQTRSATGS